MEKFAAKFLNQFATQFLMFLSHNTIINWYKASGFTGLFYTRDDGEITLVILLLI